MVLMKKDIVVVILFSISLFLFLLLFSYKTTVLFASKTAAQENTINYLQGKEELTINYTPLEISHLQDVKTVMRDINFIFYGLALVLTAIVIYYKKNKAFIQRLLWCGGITSVLLILAKLLFIVFLFNVSFTIFHAVLFPQGNWQFPADSVLIQTFPQEFFVKIGRIIFLVAFLLGIGLFSISFYFRNKT